MEPRLYTQSHFCAIAVTVLLTAFHCNYTCAFYIEIQRDIGRKSQFFYTQRVFDTLTIFEVSILTRFKDMKESTKFTK